MRSDLTHRLARAEIVASTTSWADRQAADHREALRRHICLCEVIREGLTALGIDPALAVALDRGQAAATELAGVPDTAELRAADEAILRSDSRKIDGAAAQLRAKIEQMAEHYRDGQHHPDFARASPAELWAFVLGASPGRASWRRSGSEKPNSALPAVSNGCRTSVKIAMRLDQLAPRL